MSAKLTKRFFSTNERNLATMSEYVMLQKVGINTMFGQSCRTIGLGRSERKFY